MTKRMLVTALMLGISAVVFTGCNKTPTEPVDPVVNPVEENVIPNEGDENVTPSVDEEIINPEDENLSGDDMTLTGEGELNNEDIVVVEQPVDIITVDETE